MYVAGLESKEPTVGADVITNVAIKDATAWDRWDSAYGALLTLRHRAIFKLSRGAVLYSNTFLVNSSTLLRPEFRCASST